jgi:hypothetical protein
VRHILRVITAAAVAASAWACSGHPAVVQGTVVSYAAASGTLVVKDERPPGAELAFSLQGSDIGAAPAPGDIVRLAYLADSAPFRALRVMNLTRQAELRGKPSGAH